jgi:hypothetical protein
LRPHFALVLTRKQARKRDNRFEAETQRAGRNPIFATCHLRGVVPGLRVA